MKKILLISMLMVWSFYGSAQSAHTVSLTCTSSTSNGVTGYNFYRGTTPGGPYPIKLTSSTVPTCAFTDATVQPLTTYYYIATAVCPSCNPPESINSNETKAVIPANPQPNPPTNLTNTVSPGKK